MESIFIGIFTIFGMCGIFVFIIVNVTKENKSKKHDKDCNEVTILQELQLKCSLNSMDIQKLYLENCELKSQLNKIYTNHLNENINYYKNIVLMNEKIEYIQKYMLYKCNLQHHDTKV